MKQNIKKIFFCKAAVLLSVAGLLGLAAFGIMAWGEPGQTPPAGNIASLINTGANPQIKAGDLGFNSDLETQKDYSLSKDYSSLALKNSNNEKQLLLGQDGNAVVGDDGKVITPEICLGDGADRCRKSFPTIVGSGSYWFYYYPCLLPLPDGNKKIFVGASTEISLLTSAAAADAACQTAADGANLIGTYKALVHLDGREPKDVLQEDKQYWAGYYDDVPYKTGMCKWAMVADGRADFFTEKGTANKYYLQGPVGTERGKMLMPSLFHPVDRSMATLTGFKPLGDGNYATFEQTDVCSTSHTTIKSGSCYQSTDSTGNPEDGFFCVVGDAKDVTAEWANATRIDHFTGRTVCPKFQVYKLKGDSLVNLYCVER